MTVYRVDRDVTSVSGHQTYECIARSKAEAVKKFNKADDRYVGEEVEVEGLQEVELTDVYEYFDN